MYSYVDARTVHQRLDKVVGSSGWQTSFRVVDETAKAVECTLSIWVGNEWIHRADIGYCNSADDADDDAQEPYKAAYSDALKRAAVQFGIGRHLYSDKPIVRREAAPASPLTQQLFDQGKLMALMAEHNVTMQDIGRVTTLSPTGRPLLTTWFKEHPDKTPDDLIAEAKKELASKP